MHESEVGPTSLGLMPQESPDFSPGRRSIVKLDDWIVKTAIQLAEKENPHNPLEITIEDKHILAVRQRLQDALRL